MITLPSYRDLFSYLETLDDVLVLALRVVALPALPGPGGVDAAPGPGCGQRRHPGSVTEDGGLDPGQWVTSHIPCIASHLASLLTSPLTVNIRLLLLQLNNKSVIEIVSIVQLLYSVKL